MMTAADGLRIGMWIGVVLLVAPACGDSAPEPGDSGPPPTEDAAAGRDSGTVGDSGADAGDGGGSTVGLVCANDDNCTGDGEVCCLESSPYVCKLADDCDATTGGIPCEGEDDCPSSRVCCRLPDDQFCTTRNACANFGGDEVP